MSEWWSHGLTVHIIYYWFLSCTCIITMCLGTLLTLASLGSSWASILIRRLQASLLHWVEISVASQWYYSIPLSPSSSLLDLSSCLCTGGGVCVVGNPCPTSANMTSLSLKLTIGGWLRGMVVDEIDEGPLTRWWQELPPECALFQRQQCLCRLGWTRVCRVSCHISSGRQAWPWSCQEV